MVMTRDVSGTRVLYVDGVAVTTDVLGGDVSNWDDSFPLTLVNEAGGSRPWLGTLCLVAVYDVALSASQVGDNYTTGCDLGGGPSALVEITPGGGLGATTFGNSTIEVTNTSASPGPTITSVEFDLRGSLVPDATFDPIGTAGDAGTQCLAVGTEGGTGFVAPADPCSDPFSLPHEDAPGVVGNGWDGMTVNFDDFDGGEQIILGVDVDPTTIQGATGSGGAGAVSGLELTGSIVTVTFSTGEVLTGRLFGDGSAGGASAVLSGDIGQQAPASIEMLGVTTTPTVFTNDSQVGQVLGTGTQTVRVTATPGAVVTLLEMDGAMPPLTAFDLDPFETDAATAVAYQTAPADGAGVADFTVELTDPAVLHHYVAVVDDGASGATSDILIIEIGEANMVPVVDPIADVIVEEGDTVTVPISASDGDLDPLVLSLASSPDIVALGALFTDNGDGTGDLSWETEVGDAATYSVDVTADDGTDTGTESFAIVVNTEGTGSDALFRVNAGGPEVAAADGGVPWTADQATLAADAGGAAVPGTPSIYWIAGEDKTFGTADPISLSDPSVPAGTPEALFQTERWDPPAGAEMTWEFPVGSGVAYEIDLYFAEIFATADGARVFDVEVEGVPVLTDYDVHALVGHDAGVVATVTSPIVADDALTITVLHGLIENPKVSALEVRPAGPIPPTPPTVIGIPDQTVAVSETLNLPVGTTEPNGDPVSLSFTSAPDASAFVTFTDNGDGTGAFVVAPGAVDEGTYTLTVTATDVDGSDTDDFVLTVTAAETIFARINAGGPLVAALDGGPDWEADTAAANHPFLSDPGSNNASGFPAVAPGPTVPPTVPGVVFDTERWSSAGMTYSVPVPSGVQTSVKLFVGNGFGGTQNPGARIYDISIDGVVVADDLDLIPTFGHQVGGMLEYVVTSDGSVDISFAGVVENPLVNALEVAALTSSPGQLGASPSVVSFGSTLPGAAVSQNLTLANLGFEVGDPDVQVTDVSVTGGEFTTDFAGPLTLGPGATTSVQVTFSPTAVGAQSGTITVTHDGANSPVTVPVDGLGDSNIPVSFTPSGLAGESINNPTSLQFGPDGRLYVVQQDATVYAYTVVRNGPNDYAVTATEVIDLIKNGTPNHQDDGTDNGTQQRQSTGLLVAGTAANPVVYVTSSDWRISVGSDSGLDTNSGVVSRLSWNGSSWTKVDIVRGLPRSEENHSTNGLALDESTNTLYVIQGGHANKGAPSNNFSGTPEYYLSAALLSVDLDAIEALPVYTDARYGNQFVYDLRTLNDPDRADIDNTSPDFPYPVGHPLYNATVDVGDPFGGNNGQNQAVPEPGGPVQVYSPGYRNAFDVVFTEAGRIYTSDNGPNTGWGGLPLIFDSSGSPKGTGPYDPVAGDYCTNGFNESGSNGHGDPLHYVSGPGYYGGHPTPIRAFPGLAGVPIYEEQGSNWTEVANYSFASLLPSGLTISDFPDNPVECEYSSDDPAKHLDIINSSTNGIAEYTASNFGGAMTGNLLTASFNGNVNRYVLNAAGDDIADSEVLFSGFGNQPLDVVAQGDSDPFPGTVWAATYGADAITIFEPVDFSGNPCTGADDPGLDEDGDGYTNADEIDNGTNPCSAASSPPDNDGDGVSDLNDADDDDDGIPDVSDAFAIDPDNGTTTSLPVSRPFWNFDPGTGFFGLGLTGLMTNGSTDYLDQFDPALLDAGGASGKLGVTQITAGDAFQAVNSQDNAFQYGIDVDTTSPPFVVRSTIESPFFDGQTPVNFQSMGIFIGTGDQDNYLKVVFNANGGAGGVEVLSEVLGSTSGATYGQGVIGTDLLAAGEVELLLTVDPAALTAQPAVSVDGAPPVDLGAPVTVPAAWLSSADAQGLAVGVISTSTGAGPVFGATWDNLDVELAAVVNGPPVVDPIADQVVAEGDTLSLPVVASDPDGDPLTYALSGGPSGMTISSAGVISWTPDYDDSGSYAVAVEVDDGINPVVTGSIAVDVTQTDIGTVERRINVGGPAPDVAPLDGGPAWSANPNPNTLTELVAGGGNIFLSSAGAGVPVTDFSSPTVPASTPTDVFQSERWDPPAAPEMAWNIAVTPGTTVEVRLGLAEIFNGITAPGARQFDVVIDGVTVASDVDPYALGGPAGAYVLDVVVVADADGLDIELVHVVENPNLKSIEVITLP